MGSLLLWPLPVSARVLIQQKSDPSTYQSSFFFLLKLNEPLGPVLNDGIGGVATICTVSATSAHLKRTLEIMKRVFFSSLSN